MDIRNASDKREWDDFLSRQAWRPFLQSWTMGEVYRDIGQTPVRIVASDEKGVRAICFGHVVSARRGKHLSIPYGPVFAQDFTAAKREPLLSGLFAALRDAAKMSGCTFIRMSPFLTLNDGAALLSDLKKSGVKAVTSPLHLLAEHVWYLPLKTENGATRGEEEILMQMRKTTRNLVRRAERDGVTIERSSEPEKDLEHFLRLHEETRRRHGFTPYTGTFFRSQVKRFSARQECSVYLARFQGEVIAASVHMHAFGETSYHHGASSGAHQKIPASHLLQWTAIRDALKRGDRIYNFWGIAPLDAGGAVAGKLHSHPFGGVTLFKTGFGGTLLNLMHCTDIPASAGYWLTYAFETIRKWRRGF